MFARPILHSARAFSRPCKIARSVRSYAAVPDMHAREPSIISKGEVSAVSYAGGEAQRTTLNVDEKIETPAAGQTGNDHVTPLSREIYNIMTPSMQKMTVMDKVVIITGGARGLGSCMARSCIEAGAKAMIIFDANPDLGVQSAAELHEATGSKIPVDFFGIDIRSATAIESALAAVVQKYGVPDVLINSAGIADSNIPAETYDHDMWRRLIDINLTGSFFMAQTVGKAMISAGKPGSIVLVASMSGSIVNYPQEQSCYNASKAGVIQLGKSLAAEWAKYNIRVNCISPGYMDTALNNVPALDAQKVIWKNMTPQGRLGAVDDLNGLALFLASDASAFMTGANVAIDGGYTLY